MIQIGNGDPGTIEISAISSGCRWRSTPVALIQPHVRGIEAARSACGRRLPPSVERFYEGREISKPSGNTSQMYPLHQLWAWALVGWQALFDDTDGSDQVMQVGWWGPFLLGKLVGASLLGPWLSFWIRETDPSGCLGQQGHLEETSIWTLSHILPEKQFRTILLTNPWSDNIPGDGHHPWTSPSVWLGPPDFLSARGLYWPYVNSRAKPPKHQKNNGPTLHHYKWNLWMASPMLPPHLHLGQCFLITWALRAHWRISWGSDGIWI